MRLAGTCYLIALLLTGVSCGRTPEEDANQAATPETPGVRGEGQGVRMSVKRSGRGNIEIMVKPPQKTLSSGRIVLVSEMGGEGTYRVAFPQGPTIRDPGLPLDASPSVNEGVGIATDIPAGRYTLSKIEFDQSGDSHSVDVQLPISVWPGLTVQISQAAETSEWQAAWIDPEGKKAFSVDGMEQPVTEDEWTAELTEEGSE